MKLLTFIAALLLPFTLTGQSNSFTNSPRVLSSSFDLVITEIMADPEPSFGLPESEFVEILNRSDNTINLAGWILYDGSSRVLPAYNLHPGQFLIICANSDTSDFLPFGNVAGISSISLTNSGEKIAVRTPQGLSVDSVTYSDSWYGSSFKQDGGWSLERIDPEFTCLISENWKVSIDPSGATPGAINSVNDVFTDDVIPLLLRAYCPDSNSAILVFSEALDQGSAINTESYNTNISSLITSATIVDETNSKVRLEFSDVIQPAQTGFVFVNNLTDCAGNKVADKPVKFGLADTISTPVIVINEILFNPFESGYDFIELYNAGNFITGLDDLLVASRNLTTGEIENAGFISDEPWLIFPGDYVVLTEKALAVSSFYRTHFPYGFIELNDMPAMNVDAGKIVILHNGEVIDEVYYEESYHFPLIENPKGVSLEKVNPFRNALDPDSWHSASTSSGYATPGDKNSQFSDEASHNKRVLVQPEIFSPDQDGKDDLISFNISVGEPGYISKIRIYNCYGYMIFENKGNQFLGTGDSFTWDGITNHDELAQPGIYIAVVEILNLNGDIELEKLPLVVAIKL